MASWEGSAKWNGGWYFVVSGAMFLLGSAFLTMAGPPPTSGSELLQWAHQHAFALAMLQETLMFGAGALVPACMVLYWRLAPHAPMRASFGSGLMLVAVPIILILMIVQGRLVYPVYGIPIQQPGLAALIVSIYFGGMHAVNILFAAATIALCLALTSAGAPRWFVGIGWLTALYDVVGSFPWLLSMPAVIAGDLLFSVWFVLLGWFILQTGAAQDC